MAAFSVALHVFDVESGAKVAQGDQGLWLGRYNPLRSEIDISGLMAGEYELRVGVYNWQTLERLEGVDLTSGATGQSADAIPLSGGMKMRRSRWLWVWVIPVLLLATGLAAQRLSGYPLDENEKASQISRWRQKLCLFL